MILCKPIGQRLTSLFLSFFVFSIVSVTAQDIAAGKALDLGCATGRASFELARHFEQVTGIDFSARFISLGVRASQAAGLDASSSLETAPGIKNPDAIRAFLEAAAALPPPPASFVWKGNS